MSVKSALRVLNIFECLSETREGMTIKEISEALSMPQSSTFNLVQTLHEQGYLSQTSMKKYKLGPKLIHIGTTAMESLDLYGEGTGPLSNLMKKVQETVFMATLSGDELVYIHKINSNRSIQTSAQMGYRKPLYCTGLGKSFLSFLSKEERNRILDQVELRPITDKTVIDRQQLEELLDHYGKQGYSVDDGENEEGLYCVAAPVFDASGKVTAAISVAGPRERMYSRKDVIAEEVKKTAQAISTNIGYYT